VAEKRAPESKHGGGTPSRKREKSKEQARCQRRRGTPVVGVAVVVCGSHKILGRRNHCGNASGRAGRTEQTLTIYQKNNLMQKKN